MKSRSLLHHQSRIFGVTIGLFLSSISYSAFALQPLDTFVKNARVTNPDAREAAATEEQRDAEKDTAFGKLLPSFTAQGVYTRNQYEASITFPASLFNPAAPANAPPTTLTITPQDQFDAYFTIAGPLIDVSAWERKSAAAATLEAAHASRVNTQLNVEKSVVRDYYQLLGYESLLTSTRKNLDVSRANLKTVNDKREAGTASELDVQRATADVANATQQVASAEQSVVNTRRDLETLTGVTPEPAAAFPDDDLHDEGPLERWLQGQHDDLVPVKAASLTTAAAAETRDSVKAAWIPTINAQAQERITNATGFTGHTALYNISATAQWRFDFTLSPNVGAQNAIVAESEAREDKAKRAAEDAIFTAWTQVGASIEKSRAARAQVKATALALGLANDRYGSGVATQLDVVQAQRDAFTAEVSRVQSDADLAYARASLRLAIRRTSDKESR